MAQPQLVQRGKTKKVKEEKTLQSFFSVNWKDPQSIVNFVGGMWDTRRSRRQTLERQWYINVAFYMGHQWLEWDESRGSLYQPSAPPWRVRLTANLVQGVARKIMATILQQKPIFQVVPATGDPEDIIAGRLQEKVLKYYWGGPLEADQKLVDAMVWMTTTGLGIWRLHWDPMQANEVRLSSKEASDESLIKDLKRLERKGENKINLGDAVLEIKSPFQIDPDPWATNFNNLQWLVDTTMRPVEWVRHKYPKTGKDVSADDDGDLNHFEKRIADFGGPSSATFTGAQRSSRAGTRGDSSMVNVHEVWALPFNKFDRGIYAVIADDTLLDIRQNQYRANGKVALPYSFFEEIKVPGRLWPTCALEQCISLQAEYNRGRSQIIENRNQMSRPKWLVPEGANIGDYALTSEPGEVVRHTFGHAPTMSTPPPLPNYVIKTMDLARSDIQDVSQIHDVSQGKQPGSVRAGKAIVALQEQDASVLGPTIAGLEKALEKFGGMLMELLSRKIKENRLVKIVGSNDLYEVQEFLGTDLLGKSTKDKPGVNYHDVRVKIGSQLPLTPDARRQFITELVQAGILNAEADKRRILEMLELGSEEPLYDVARLDFANQRQENRLMIDGFPMEVQDYDDDKLHLEVLINFQKTPEYAENRTPQTDLIFQDHRSNHEGNMKLKLSGEGVLQPDLSEINVPGDSGESETIARSVARARTPLEVQ